MQERLAAPGQVTEDVADALAELGLPDGRLHGRLLHRGEGLADLADLIGGGGDGRRLGGSIHFLARRQPAHHVGQPLVRQFQRGLPEGGQLAHQAAPDPQAQGDGDGYRDQAQAADQEQPEVGGGGLAVGLAREPVRCLQAGRLETGADLADRLLPRERRDRRHGARPGADHRVLQRQQRQVPARADGVGVVGAVLGIEVGERQVVERPAGPHELGEGLEIGRGELAAGLAGRQQRVLLRQHVLRLAHPHERQRLGHQLRAVLLADRRAQDPVGLLDDGVVLAEGPRAGDDLGGDLRTHAGQAGNAPEEAGDGLLLRRGRVAHGRAGGEGGAHGGRRRGGLCLLNIQLGEIRAAGRGHVNDCQQALGGQLGHERGHWIT